MDTVSQICLPDAAMRFILRPPNFERIQANTVENVMAINPDGPVMCVRIDEYIEDKTAEQRAFWHVLIRKLADEIGFNEDEMKLIIKARLYGVKEIKVAGLTLNVPAQSTERLSKKRYSSLIEATYVYAGEAGITLPPPRWRHEA